MSIRIGAFRTKRLTFLIAFLASVTLHSLLLISLKKPQETENIVKSESLGISFLGSLENTEDFGKKVPDAIGLDSNPYIESRRVERGELPFDHSAEIVSTQAVPTKLKKDFNVLVKNGVAKRAKLERNPNERILTVLNSEEIPLNARLYLNSWEKKIEKIGNLNYPKKAAENKIYGSLELLVSILPSGELNDIRLIESSGHVVLDKAAISIVKMASPFAPFPEEMLQNIDLLEVIRIWDFRRNASWSFKVNDRNR